MNASANSSYPFDLFCGMLVGINGLVGALLLIKLTIPDRRMAKPLSIQDECIRGEKQSMGEFWEFW
jgi:hypothetical protein